MEATKFILYIIWGDNEYIINLSPRPEVDLEFYRREKGYCWGVVLTPPLPVAIAWEVLERIATVEERQGRKVEGLAGGGGNFWIRLVKVFRSGVDTDMTRLISDKFRKASKLLGERGLTSGEPVELVGAEEGVAIDFSLVARIRAALAGRILYPGEIGEVLRGRGGGGPEDLSEILQLMYLQGWCEVMPAVGWKNGLPRCYRCGHQGEKVVAIDCIYCGSQGCMVCEECIMMGGARTCLPLYAFRGVSKAVAGEPIQAVLDFPLTPAQRDAGGEVADFVAGDHRDMALIWAACGAGKTEVAFEAIASTLSRGEKVLFAIPRRDVVLELEPRLKKAFPNTVIRTLYGGSKEKFLEGQLVIATTHQAIRFYRNFELVVLDEVDAFPYQGSDMLHYAVERSRKPEGKLVLMTATPDRDLLHKARSGKAAMISIPARHHGHPLPVPELVQLPAFQKDKSKEVTIGRPVIDFLHRSVEGEGFQVFVFVPTIALAEATARALRETLAKQGASMEVHFSHSKDPRRDEKREAFARGDFPLLVTTSILERGITISRCNVLVLFGEKEHIYDAGTLVQMAGRAGRTTEAPTGTVWFVGSKVTEAMKEARGQIEFMNEVAGRKGYLSYQLSAVSCQQKVDK
ncbi:MAG: helicase-related protein [Clostridia bacterium]|nr:helicase-related protein [Clostridia bacterium]